MKSFVLSIATVEDIEAAAELSHALSSLVAGKQMSVTVLAIAALYAEMVLEVDANPKLGLDLFRKIFLDAYEGIKACKAEDEAKAAAFRSRPN